VSGILRVEILAANAAGPNEVRFRTHFLYLLSDIGALQRGRKPDQIGSAANLSDNKYIDGTLRPDGQIAQVSGSINSLLSNRAPGANGGAVSPPRS